ncbi:MAG: GtrA family protein [Streptococcaceae bacterium]|jgi:putative flippase GtrA|nr:GtrA family protein [Streptococcaceae bacterium]
MKTSKIFANEVVLYLIFGVLTTLVYFITRFTVLSFGLNTIIALTIAQIAAVLFAFFTNKLFVFKSTKSDKPVLLEFIQFVGGRLTGYFIDFIISYLCIELGARFFIALFHLKGLPYQSTLFKTAPFSDLIGTPELVNQFIWALVIQVLIIVINYFISKFIVFKKEEEHD